MNSEQLRLFLSGAFGNEADARKVERLIAPYLIDSLREIRRLVEQLPDESLARQREWRKILDEVERVLEPYNDAFAIELSRQLPVSGAEAAEQATLMLKSVVPQTAGLVPPSVIIADSTKYLLNTQISNRRLLGLFSPTKVGGASPFTKSNRRLIDTIVTSGIINGTSTANIADMIYPEIGGREPRYIGTKAAKQFKTQADAIARTAIQDYNRQVNEEVWNANRDAFARSGLKYEWVSALDSITCPSCAALDGDVRDKRNDFPKWPLHIRCRCQVVITDPEDPGKIRYGQEAMTVQPSGKGAYKTQKKVKGEMLYRRNREVKTVDGKSPRYADFLATADLKTQEMFFGGGNAGKRRAEFFAKQYRKGGDAQKALMDTLKVQAETAKGRKYHPEHLAFKTKKDLSD